MKNFEIFNRINSEEQENYMKDGVESTSIVTSSTVILAGRVKTIITGETKTGKPKATLVLSAGAKQYTIQSDGSIKLSEPERTDEEKIPSLYIDFYNSSKPKGSKAYDDIMRLSTPKSEGKPAAVEQGRIVIVKASKQVRTSEDGSQFTTYMGTRVYIGGCAEVQENKAGEGCFVLLGSVTLFEKDGEYSLSMPMNMQNPVTGKYDITCFIECKPASGQFTPEMIQNFAKRGDHCARVALLTKTDGYNIDTTNPLKPTAEAVFESFTVIPEFEENEFENSARGSVVTA